MRVLDGLRATEASLELIETVGATGPKSPSEIAKDALRPLRQAIEDIEAAIEDDWFSMDSAPTDASSILVVVNGLVRQVFYCGPWNVWLPDGTDISTIDFELDDRFGIGADLPTMWRHVPPAPVARRKLQSEAPPAPSKPDLPSLVLEYFRIRSMGVASTDPRVNRLSRLAHLETSMVFWAKKEAAARDRQVSFDLTIEGIIGRWVEIRVPGNEPQLKGPFNVSMLRDALVDLMTHRRDAFVTVIALDREGPMLLDGANCLLEMDPLQADLIKGYRADRVARWAAR